MKLKDMLRTMLRIRNTRQLDAVCPKPPVGSNIVRDRLRIRLNHPIDDEAWEWFARMGWRTTDMRKDRRQYMNVPDRVLLNLIKANNLERQVLHISLMELVERQRRQSSARAER